MQNENIQTEDAGLLALWLFLRLQGVHAALDQIRERCGTTTIDIRTMLRCAGQFGVTVGSRTTHWKHLVGMRLPGIAALRDGGFLLLGRVDDSGALVLYPNSLFFFKQKTAYDVGLGIPAEPLFRSPWSSAAVARY